MRLYFSLVGRNAAGEDCFFEFLDFNFPILIEVKQVEHVISSQACRLASGFLSFYFFGR